MTTDASHRRGLVPPIRHHAVLLTRPSRSFGERRPVTGTVLTVIWLVVIGTLVGVALGSVITVVVRGVLGLATSWLAP